ncbi:hypothetical protein [Blastococcus sp. URHD0036]|uniref:aa3-type cytochrome oxidase subunit CtaJ n=1 Tax=Blastococcus sp. URHD0036 TaxID=1380356 RepID=UPI0004958D5A|nr:hypothetical protein [Blastococcus sp. URHD0036]
MSTVETILVFAGIPLAIILLFAALTLLPGRARKARYKPGQQWEYPPVWWEPHPTGSAHDGGHGGAHALTAGHSTATSAGPLGGARGTW